MRTEASDAPFSPELVSVALSPDGGDMLRPRTQVPPRALPNTTEFYELVPELAAKPSDLRVTKRQPNAFYGTDLDLQLRRRGVTGIVLTGIATSQGVETMARAANERGYNLTFPSDAITDMDPASHDYMLQKLFPRLGEIDTTDAVLKLLGAR
jgi:nicotinamidase-related amidase